MDIDTGFRIGDRLFAWGTTIDHAADALGVARDAGRGTRWRRIEIGCGPTWGFDTIGAELTAYGGDRPVTALRYELAADPGHPLPPPERWTEPLAAVLGPPLETRSDDLSDRDHPEGGVRHYARWPKGDQSVGLSLYGAPRAVGPGLAAGCLWLNWATEAAARPFIDAWRTRAATLAAEADRHSGLVFWSLSEPPHPLVRPQDDADRDSMNALGSPQLLPTPAPIAKALGSRGIGFWRSGDQQRWYASTCWDTIGFDLGGAIEIDFYDVAPAKGGGYWEIAVDGWSARDLYRSRGIEDAVAALRTIPGVRIRKVGGYDC